MGEIEVESVTRRAPPARARNEETAVTRDSARIRTGDAPPPCLWGVATHRSPLVRAIMQDGVRAEDPALRLGRPREAAARSLSQTALEEGRVGMASSACRPRGHRDDPQSTPPACSPPGVPRHLRLGCRPVPAVGLRATREVRETPRAT